MSATSLQTKAAAPVKTISERRSVDRLLAQLEQIAERSPHFISKSLGQFQVGGETWALPRYVHLGE